MNPSTSLVLDHAGLGPDGLAADLGDLGLGLLEPALGALHGVVVVLGLAAHAEEAVGEAVGARQELVVGLGDLRDLDRDLRLGLLQVARPHLHAELVQAGGVFLVEIFELQMKRASGTLVVGFPV